MERGRTLREKSFLMKKQTYTKISAKQLVHLYMKSSFTSTSTLQGIRKNLQGKSAISPEKHQYYIEAVNQVAVTKEQEIQEPNIQQFEQGKTKITLENNKKIEYAIKIQAYFRKHQKRKVYKQLVKNARYRKNIIMELIKTEDQYVQDLQLIFDKIIKPLESIVKQNDIQILFSNLIQIHQLNTQFLNELKERFDKYYPNIKIADIMIKYILTTTIISKNKNSIVIHLKIPIHSNKIYSYLFLRFLQFVSDIPKQKELRFLTYDDYIIKPVQRLPKYVLLLKDLLKYTKNHHPDYSNIQNAFNLFSKVNAENNDKLNQITSNQILFDLQTQFGDKIQLVDPKRKYLLKENLQILRQNKQKPIIVYFLSDLLLIVKKKSNSLYHSIYLDSDTQVKELRDSQHFTNLISITNKLISVTLISDSANQKKMIINKIQEIIKNSSKNQSYKYLIEVKVLGTEERSGLLQTQVVYIIQVKNYSIIQKIYLTFKECFKIQEIVQKEYPSLQLIERVHFESGHDAKVIEARKIQIENFFQSLLNNNPSAKILEQLGLTSQLYDEKMRNSSFKYGAVSRRSLRYSPRRSLSLSFVFSSQSFSVSQQKKKDMKIQVNGQKIHVDNQTRVFDLFIKMEDRYELESTWDFKFLIYDNKQLRALEDDEIIDKLPEKTIFFKKFYYLSQAYEVYEYLSDRQKLNLVYNQTMQEMKEGNLKFKFEDLCIILAGHLYNNFSIGKVEKMIPSSVFKQNKKELWIQQIQSQITKLNKVMNGKMTLKEDIVRLFQLCLMRQVNTSIGILRFQVMSEQKEEVELKISYDGAVLNDGEYVEEIQCQPGLVLVNGKKYMSNQGYQIKYLFDEYQQLGLEMKDVDDEFEEKENELRELLRAFEIQSYDQRQRR